MSLRYRWPSRWVCPKCVCSSRDKAEGINKFGNIAAGSEPSGASGIVSGAGVSKGSGLADVQARAEKRAGTLPIRLRRSHQRWKEKEKWMRS